METLPEILKQLKNRTTEISQGTRNSITANEKERARMAAETLVGLKKRTVEVRSDAQTVIKTSRHWRTGAPLPRKR